MVYFYESYPLNLLASHQDSYSIFKKTKQKKQINHTTAKYQLGEIIQF